MAQDDDPKDRNQDRDEQDSSAPPAPRRGFPDEHRGNADYDRPIIIPDRDDED